MAYNLQSLVRVIELMLSHDTHKYFDNITTPQIESLLEKVCFLRDTFENHPTLSNQDSFEDQTRDATQHAEDVLEAYAASFATRPLNMKKLLAKFAESRFACFATDVHMHSIIPPAEWQNLLENFDSLKKEMMKICEDDRIPVVKASSSTVASIVDRNPTNIVVGFKNDLSQLMDRILGDSSKLEIIPIVGMGGIGKTTLARRIYDDSSIVSHFDTRAWATVSNDYNLHDILFSLLGSKRDETAGVEDNNLGLTLYQGLAGKRYLILLDDVWHSKAWDDVKKCFPNENNASRIILTTRHSDVATYVDSKSLHHQVHPLNEVDSWELLEKKVFGEKTCLPELEELGRNIANCCGGLPLAIQVIGGLLSQTERTKCSWEKVASEVISTIANEDEQVSSILALSYDHLPYYIKPCFLYMSAFREDFEIGASRLIRLWIAEGFLIPIQGKGIKEVAVEFLNALIDRNLIFVRNRTTVRGRVKTLGIHDLLRDLCVVKARESKFLHVINGRTDHNISQDMLCLRRVSVLTCSCIGDVYGSSREKPLARSLLNLHSFVVLEMSFRDSSTLQLLRVLEMGDNQFSITLHQAVNLRYLAFNCGKELHPSITTFRNLQTLILQGRVKWDQSIEVPEELFEMPHLREIMSEETVLRCKFKKTRKFVIQRNLQKVSLLFASANLDLFLAKHPNLKKLGLKYGDGSHPPVLEKSCLQKLYFYGKSLYPIEKYLLLDFSFPITLTSVSLNYLTISEASMTTLGMVPNLESLKLNYISFEPTKNWKLSPQGKFCRLKYLSLAALILVNWECDETHFPVLQHLDIACCYELNELPSAIGEIPTLKRLLVYASSPAAGAWAMQIQEEQLDYGNELLQVLLIDDSSSSEYSSDG